MLRARRAGRDRNHCTDAAPTLQARRQPMAMSTSEGGIVSGWGRYPLRQRTGGTSPAWSTGSWNSVCQFLDCASCLASRSNSCFAWSSSLSKMRMSSARLSDCPGDEPEESLCGSLVMSGAPSRHRPPVGTLASLAHKFPSATAARIEFDSRKGEPF